MDFIIDLIVFLIRALLNQTDRKKATAPPTRPASQAPAASSSQARTPALAPRTPVAPQVTPDEGERWRRVVTLLALLVLVIMGAAWFVYTQGFLR